MKIVTLLFYVYLLLPCCILQRIFPFKLQLEENTRSNGVCNLNQYMENSTNSTLSKVKQLIQDEINPILQSSCGGTGWTRVAFLNMTDPSAVCPSELRLLSSPVTGCTRERFSSATCDSVIFPLHGRNYSKVCGKILAYQQGGTNAFRSSYYSSISIETQYVSGISLTYGPQGGRHHIWTFAAARYEQNLDYSNIYNCHCTNNRYRFLTYYLPTFVGTDYFCDTGNVGFGYSRSMYYSNDPLWDGTGCGVYSTCCSFNTPPWFVKELPQATTNDIEMRLCNRYRNSENIVVFFTDLYVK